MTNYEKTKIELRKYPKIWLVTGVGGFIGSNLLEALLKLDQKVIGLENFATGHQNNLDEVQSLVTPEQWARFTLILGDIRNLEDCRQACANVDYVLHQAALGSVPRSLSDPIMTNETNIVGHLKMLIAARDAKVKSFTYAASSSTYGDHTALPKIEEIIGKPMSPYAVTKYVNELYSDVFSRNYDFQTIGLRYFNVFGPRQDPEGAYAAVVPTWISAILKNKYCYINGDGETSRDFCYVKNVVQANLLAATTTNLKYLNQVYNVAVGNRTSLNELHRIIYQNLRSRCQHITEIKPIYRDFRKGDVLHSLAEIRKISKNLGYQPTHNIENGLIEAMDWYIKRLNN